MSEPYISFLQYPCREIREQHNPNIASDHNHHMELAGPFFDIGGSIICLSQLPVYKSNFHRSEKHRLVLIVQGRIEFRIENKTFIGEPGDLICTPEGCMTQRRALEPIEWLYFDILDTPFWEPLKKNGPTIRRYESADIMYLMVRKILSAHRSQDLYSISCANEYSGMLVTLLKRELTDYGKEMKANRADEMIDLIERVRQHPEYEWTLSSLAREAGMSGRNLHILFNKIFGTSPGQMIIRIRMEHAMQLLRNSSETIETIGQSVGYESIVSFSRAFKNYLGMSPGTYRNRK